jgi:hypothetical protein
LVKEEGIDDIREIDPQEQPWPYPPIVRFDGISIEPDLPKNLYITDTTFSSHSELYMWMRL